jgi:GTP-binding protein HflX
VTVHKAGVVLLDHELSPSQARNLEKETGAEVMDRTAVILEIFHRHARSRAAKAQVEIVRLEYMAPRLREAGKGRDRQRGGIGGKGAGESGWSWTAARSAIRIAELSAELRGAGGGAVDPAGPPPDPQPRRPGRVHQRRQVHLDAGADRQRGVRRRQAVRHPRHHRAHAAPRDPPRGSWSRTPSASSTSCPTAGGLVQEHLDEALEASLLVHVIDASDPAHERQLAVTAEVLDEIGAGAVPACWCSTRSIAPPSEAAASRSLSPRRWPDALVMSARRPDDVAHAPQALIDFFARHLVEEELRVPYSRQELRGAIFEHCQVLEERYEENDVVFRVRAAPAQLAGCARPDAPPARRPGRSPRSSPRRPAVPGPPRWP